MKRFFTGAMIGLCSLLLSAETAGATAVFTSVANLSATLSLGNGASLTGLGFLGSSSFYSATAIAGAGDHHSVSSGTINIDRGSSGPLTFEQLLGSSSLATQMFSDENHSLTDYPTAYSSAANAVALAQGQPSGSGLTIGFDSNIFGMAFPTDGHASAGVAWEGVTRFTNLTAQELLLTWTVTYFLSASAHVDDPTTERAVTETQLLAGFGSEIPSTPAPRTPFAFIAAADPALDTPISEIPIRPSPDPVSGSLSYELRLAPGASDSFHLVIDQFGIAEVVPLPAPIFLLLTALGAIGAVARKRSC